jgi:hypothetical protein
MIKTNKTPPHRMRHLNFNRARIPKIRGEHKYHLSNVYFIDIALK